MLYRLQIQNFYSIYDPQDIDLRVAGNAPEHSDRLAPIWTGAEERAAKTVAIFGANASGKSTVLRALSFIVQFVAHSFSASPTSRIMFDRFNSEAGFSEPTRLAVELAGPVDYKNLQSGQCRYSYELVIGGPSDGAVVDDERVYFWPHGKKTLLVHRTRDGTVKSAKAFELQGFKTVLEKVLRPNASIISTLAQLNHQYALQILQAAQTVQSNIFIEKQEADERVTVRHYNSNRAHLQMLNREISRIDLGIAQVDILAADNGPFLQFLHHGLAVPMPIHLESHGTRSFLQIYPYLQSALEQGGIAILDELDASIHPMILPEILSWFHDPIRNPLNAQLWITCHNAALLDFLSKDEVLFCQKSSDGKSEVYALNDIAAVRRDDNFYRKYLSGLYGAVPQIG